MVATAPVGVWEGWRRATCFPFDCFCETPGPGWIAEPANAWSSFGFVIVALLLAGSAARGDERTVGLKRAEAWLLAASLMIVGFGSAFYHASLTWAGQVIDVTGMYFVATFVLLHRLAPRWKASPAAASLLFVAINALLMVAQVTTPILRRFVFALLVISAIAVEWREATAGRKWLVRAALAMSLGFVTWAFDRWRIVCLPDTQIQGHAIWHVLGAVASACLCLSYRAEARAA
jgi:hypothetical protein